MLIFALSVMVIIATISLSIQRTTRTLIQVTREDELQKLSFVAADAGISYAEGIIKTQILGSPYPEVSTAPLTPPEAMQRLGPTSSIPSWLRTGDWNSTTGVQMSQVQRDASAPLGDTNPMLFRTTFRVKVNPLDTSTGDLDTTTGIDWRLLVNNYPSPTCGDAFGENQTACDFGAGDIAWFRISSEGRAFPTDVSNPSAVMTSDVAITRIISYFSVAGQAASTYVFTSEGWEITGDPM